MATFGNSFKELLMAEAMLEEDFRSSHENLNKISNTNTQEATNTIGNPSSSMASSSSSSLKRKTSSNDKGDINAPSLARDGPHLERKNSERSVQITLPPKRRRLSGNYSVADIVQALSRAMTTEERLEALENAIGTFDHDNTQRHDHEIAAGADIALVKALIFLEFKTGFRREPIQADMDVITKEIGMVLTALECIYRASSESVKESFSRVGTELLHILVILIDDEVKHRLRILNSQAPSPEQPNEPDRRDDQGNDSSESAKHQRPVTPPSPEYSKASVGIHARDTMLRMATKCLGHYARVGKATKPMAHFPGFIGTTLNLINIRPYSTVPFEARLSCLWTIANLACNTENMTMMSCTPNLLDSLISISCRRPEGGDSLETIMEVLRAKSIASRALLNLSWSPENKILMSDCPALLESLSSLALERRAPYRKSKTMQEIMLHTRRNSIGALRNIAAAPRRCKISLCEFNSGKLLDAMTDVALNETDQQAVDIAFACIHNLAIHDTAEAIVDRPALVLALKNVLLEDDTDEQGGEARNSRKSHASSTILVLERTITEEMPSYENLRELLDAVNPSNSAVEDESNGMMPSVNATAV
ncbi:MAG: hypothetical protein SGILL_009684 [Bacillariaceae sp.]